MTPGQSFGRRALLAGAGVLGAASVLSVEGCESSSSTTPPAPGTPGTPASGEPTVDLTVRWRHLEPRVSRTGLWTHLVAGWPFDEGSGYTFGDVTGNGHSLVITGSDWNTTESGLLGAVHRQGLRGNAVWLNGRRWLATAPAPGVSLTPDGLTVTAWLQLASRPTAGTVVALGSTVAITLDTDRFAELSVAVPGESSPTVVRSRTVVPTDVWVSVAATVDPSSGTLAIAIGTEPPATTRRSPFTITPPSTSVLEVGRGLTALLDELTVHDSVLTPPELQRVRLLGLPRTFTQTSASIDEERRVFGRFAGSEAVPHPVEQGTLLSVRFEDGFAADQGARPEQVPPATFVPGRFGCAWHADDRQAVYRSPLTGDSGTFEAWYTPVADPGDTARDRHKVVFSASASHPPASLVLSTLDRRWRVDVTTPTGHRTSALGPVQPFPPGALAHVAVAWGIQPDGVRGVQLMIDGRPVARVETAPGATTYDDSLSLGGTAGAPAFCALQDVRVSGVTLGWGDVCPRGQVSTEAAGLDLRDWFRRPVGLSSLCWKPGQAGADWPVVRRDWLDPTTVGDDPASNLAVGQLDHSGVRSLYHPDAFGHASSIEATVAFETLDKGWAGVFLQSKVPLLEFSGVTFMLDPDQSALRLARYAAGKVVAQKVIPYDFTMRPQASYELTLTCAGDGIVRGFVDHANMISMRTGAGWPMEGYAGLVTDACAATFSAVHFTALTPATSQSRTVRTHVMRYGEGAAVSALDLVPFRWHKRRGMLPWEYDTKNPEQPGNIAGADTPVPLRPIASAHWRSEDSANSDLLVLDGTVWYLMRGNPRIDEHAAPARIGMLHTAATAFDGVHFTDPNEHTDRLAGDQLLTTGTGLGAVQPNGTGPLELNSPSSGYVGSNQLLFLGREATITQGGQRPGETVFARFDTAAGRWEEGTVSSVAWSDTADGQVKHIHGTPELVILRHPVTDAYQGVVYQQLGVSGSAVMGTALIEGVSAGVPRLVPGMPLHSSLSRADKGAIYGFRVMFDNGIYYLHYNDGPEVPDWPSRFVLAAALDPYAGPWVENADTAATGSTYFTRGTEFEPDNGAIWQGTMCKIAGRYYLYYENYHAIGDVDAQYADYDAPQAGSRVGFATA